MKLVITTPALMSREAKFAEFMDGYDSTFSSRYLIKDNIEGIGDFSNLKGERHWDGDKYNIMYVDLADEKLPGLIEEIKENEICNVIAQVDETYQVIGDPLFVSSNLMQAFLQQKRGDKYIIPGNILRRENGFIPQSCP